MNNLAGSLIVGYDFSEDHKGVLIIGKQEKKKGMTVLNAFQDQEAWDLLQKLITQQKKEEENA